MKTHPMDDSTSATYDSVSFPCETITNPLERYFSEISSITQMYTRKLMEGKDVSEKFIEQLTNQMYAVAMEIAKTRQI